MKKSQIGVGFVLMAGATALAYQAGNPPTEPDPNCKTPTECVNEALCPGLNLCFNQFGDPQPIPEPDPGQSAYDVADPEFQALNRQLLRCLDQMLIAFNTCLSAVCVETVVATTQTPTISDCIQALTNRLEECKFTSGCPNTGMVSEGRLALYKEYCEQSAYAAFQRCASLVFSPSARSAEDIESGIFAEGIFEHGVVDVAAGETVGELLWVPMNRDHDPSMRIIVSTVQWINGAMEVVEIDDFSPGNDGIIEISIDVASFETLTRTDSLPIVLEWRDEQGSLYAQAIRIGIVESGIPGDFNRDGERTASDLATFIDAYDHNAPRADRNGDGVVNAADLALFLAEYDRS